MTTGFGHYAWVWAVAIVALLLFVLWRRGRRMIGRQRYSSRRTGMRTIVLTILTIFLAITYAHRGYAAMVYESLAAGFVIGAIIAGFALRSTRMGRDEHGLWYTPNLYLGIGLIALLIGRYVYEYFVVFPKMQQHIQAASHGAGTFTALPHPVLYATLFLVLGYYVVYYAGIMLRIHKLEAATPTEN